MRALYIGFSYPKKFKVGAAAIAIWMNRDYSHVYTRFAYKDSKDAVFHAAHGMVHFRSYENFLKENHQVKEYKFIVTEDLHNELFDECMDLAGDKYSKLTLLKIFAADLVYSLFNKVVSFKDSPGYICSELVGKFCTDKFNISFCKPLSLLKPSDVDYALESNQNKV